MSTTETTEHTAQVLSQVIPFYRRRNTPTFTFMSWAGFALAVLAQYAGIFNLEEPLAVKGYYAIGGAFLIVSCLVLQKTIRDNEEDRLNRDDINE